MFQEFFKEAIMGREEFHFFPKACERSLWEGLPHEIKERLVGKGERFLNFTYPNLFMTQYMQFQRASTREPYDRPSALRTEALSALVMAECVEYRGRFMDDIINGLFCIMEETSWVIAAHNWSDPMNNCSPQYPLPNIENDFYDLAAATRGLTLALTYYLLGEEFDRITPIINRTIVYNLNRRILRPYLNYDKMWWKTYHNNWNTHCTKNSFFIAMIMMEDEKMRRKAAQIAMNSIEIYMKNYAEDGFCAEGPHYWSGNIIDLTWFLRVLQYVADSSADVFNNEKLKRMILCELDMYVGNGHYASISDAKPILTDWGTSDFAAVYFLGKQLQNESLTALAKKRMADITGGKTLFDMLTAVFSYEQVMKTNAVMSFDKTAYYESIQIMFARECEHEEGLYFAVKGGCNEELHNQNDVGNFLLYYDTKPVIIDAGMGEYTKTAFSDLRYTLWFMNSKYHNVPHIGGVEQKNGPQYRAVNVSHREDCLSMDIAPAYGDARIKSWVRTTEYDRKTQSILFTEDYQLSEEMEIDLVFMLCRSPKIEENRILLSEDVAICFRQAVTAEVGLVDNQDSVMEKMWGKIYRLTVKIKGKQGSFQYEIRTGRGIYEM